MGFHEGWGIVAGQLAEAEPAAARETAITEQGEAA